MEPISITVTGRIADEPYRGTTDDGTAVTALNLEVQGRGPASRWIKVVAYGALATRVAGSVRPDDRVTVRADDLWQRSWISDKTKEAAGRITLRAWDIAASMFSDTLTTGQAARRAGRLAAANGEVTDLPAAEAADASVVAGVTADAA